IVSSFSSYQLGFVPWWQSADFLLRSADFFPFSKFLSPVFFSCGCQLTNMYSHPDQLPGFLLCV
ncbi:MAG: hypothetical protein ACK559_11865, partial [bacterium]